MAKASASEDLPVSAYEAETLWYDTTRWTAWVEALARVEEVSPGWPAAGVVRWRSTPGGRGAVEERVVAYEVRSGQTVEVVDEQIVGRQIISFEPSGANQVKVRLTLEYRIRRRTLLTPLIDLLFVRPVMRTSLQGTLSRFRAQLLSATRRG